MVKKINWKAYTSKGRTEMIDAVKNCILKSDGCIINFTMFSDLEISLCIEIDEYNVLELNKNFSNIITISGLDETAINPNSKKECMIFLNISFSTAKGDLKMDIPEVPG